MERMTYVKHPHSWNRGKYPTKYTSRHTFQEVVARLAAYEDTGLEPPEIMALIAPPNPPLTVEDLRGIDGEPVWCGPYKWQICYGVSDFRGYQCLELGGGEAISLVGYGDSWNAYRRKPEEESR